MAAPPTLVPAETVIVTATAPVNMAVIKYWGKRDEKLILPINSSLSATLNQKDLCSITSIAASKSFEEDEFWLNGEKQNMSSERIQNCLKGVRERAQEASHDVRSSDGRISKKTVAKEDWPDYRLKIVSENNFPTAAGLASSASGYACFVAALAKLYGLEGDVSTLARQGSGSACRSMYGGFVKWEKGEDPDGSDSRAIQVFDENHWPEMQILVLVVNDAKKAVGSSEGMRQSVQTSPGIHKHASEVVPERLGRIEEAISKKDFPSFADLTMQDSDSLHRICEETVPSIRYLNETSRSIISFINAYNAVHGKNVAAYTFDAGPNAVLFTTQDQVQLLLKHILNYFPPREQANTYVNNAELWRQAEKEHIKQELIEKLPDLKPNVGALKYILHTTVGPGPQYLPENYSLIKTQS